MQGPDGFDSYPTPLEREANRWIALLFAATYGFAVIGMVMGFGTVIHRSAYYIMLAFFLAALVSAVLTIPLLYLTSDKGPDGL
jgi:Mn2+/Fe2+ NRAMP family transporter